MILAPDGPQKTTAPEGPHALAVAATECGLTLSWRQRGAVDYWTVWLDQLDGEDVTFFRTIEPRYEIEDLPPGGHLVGVYSTRTGSDSAEQVEAAATVPGLAPGQPNVPVITDLAADGGAVTLSWIAPKASRSTVQLLDAASAVLDRRDCPGTCQVSFTGLAPRTRYGVRVQSVASTRLSSPWCPIRWFDTAEDR